MADGPTTKDLTRKTTDEFAEAKRLGRRLMWRSLVNHDLGILKLLINNALARQNAPADKPDQLTENSMGRDIVDQLRSVASPEAVDRDDGVLVSAKTLDLAAATIETLRAEVRAWRTQDHNLVHANADQYVVREPMHVPITRRVLDAMAATDASGALGSADSPATPERPM